VLKGIYTIKSIPFRMLCVENSKNSAHENIIIPLSLLGGKLSI